VTRAALFLALPFLLLLLAFALGFLCLLLAALFLLLLRPLLALLLLLAPLFGAGRFLLALLFLLCLLLFASCLLLLAALLGLVLPCLLPGIAGSLAAAFVRTGNFTIVFAPLLSAAGFAWRNAGLLRRHLRRTVALTRGLRSDYVAPAEFARPTGSCDAWTSVILRREHLTVLARSALMLDL